MVLRLELQQRTVAHVATVDHMQFSERGQPGEMREASGRAQFQAKLKFELFQRMQRAEMQITSVRQASKTTT